MSAKTVETLKARLAEAEAGIVGKIAARMGWVHMASVDELVTFVEEWTVLHREALSEAATAERQRLAALASAEDREMVDAFGRAVADFEQVAGHSPAPGDKERKHARALRKLIAIVRSAREAIEATLAARRAEALGEALRWSFENFPGFTVGLSPGLPVKRTQTIDDYVASGLAALLPRGPERNERSETPPEGA